MNETDARDYRDLDVWQVARGLAIAVYQVTQSFPKEEQFGLVSQMRRGAVSVAANIAEGNGRFHRNDYARFVSIARGSVTELECLLDIAGELGMAPERDLAAAHEMATRVSQMLFRLYHKLADH